MKTLVLGDIHGRTVWKRIIEKERPDKVIFLGDYVASHENISAEQQISNLEEILDYKCSHPDSTILLRGNHDVQHLTGDDTICCYSQEVDKWMRENKNRFMSLTQWVYEDGDIIFTHAGISKTWYDRHEFDSISEINEDNRLANFEFTPCRLSDCYGDSPTQPPTWIRPQTLAECAIPNKTYIVGHTAPRGHICDYVDATLKAFPDLKQYVVENIHIWLCDKLPKEYLVIEDGEFGVKTVDNQ